MMMYGLQVIPVVAVVSFAACFGTTFMSWKLFNTPDVTVDPTKPFHYQAYAKASQVL